MFVVSAIAVLLALGILVTAFVLQRDLRSENKHKTAELYVRTSELEQERSERSRIEETLNFTRGAYQAAFANTRDMVFLHTIRDDGLPGPFVEVNEVMCRKLEYPREKLLSLSPMDIEAAEVPSALLRHGTKQEVSNPVDEIKTLSRDRQGVELDAEFAAHQSVRRLREEKMTIVQRTYTASGGTHIQVEVVSILFEANGREMVMGTALDVTPRMETEKAMKNSERMFRDFFSHSPLGVAIYDADRQLVDVNPSFLKTYGAPDRAEFARFNLFSNPYIPGESANKLAAGESVRCEMTIDFDDARDRHMLLTTRRGIAYFELLFTTLGVDAQFKNKGYLVQSVDITRRMSTEKALRESEKQLRQAQKMEAIGTFAGGIAHDFNNILTPILGYAEIALDCVEGRPDLKDFIQEIHKAGNRAKELVNQILTFSRQSEDETQRKPIRITPIVKEVLALLRAAAPPNIEINRVIKTERDVVVADPTQIHQVLMNLCTNARQAIGTQAGQIEVWMTDFVAGVRSRAETTHLEPGRYLRISVKDSGCGMDAATLERIFEPFFTTKKSGEGTGLGLSVVHGIVTSMGGDITVNTAPGKGSTFHVVLPVLEQAAATEDVDVSALPKGTESVLFVDDDAGVARLASHLLASLGYESVVVTQGADAVERFRASPNRYSVVITDQLMPGMTGIEVARQIREIRPDMPIILCSGFTDNMSPEQAALVGIHAFLSKPLARRTLADAIRRAIDSGRRPASPGDTGWSGPSVGNLMPGMKVPQARRQ